ncbi:MAG: zinc ribbon domain-containing protein [Acidobacteria bacterium]|nr:zinc ribbon domain-containing protein [Acidobacteriota bacterium]
MNPRAYDTKTTLKQELKVVPAVGYAVAGAWLVVFFAVVMPLILRTAHPKPGEPPLWLIAILLTFAGAVLALWVVMIFYVNADAGRRQMNRTLWTLLVIFIPNAIGFILYFVLRHPIARPCPKCGASVRPDFVFCPACGESLTSACPACRHTVEPGWAACAFCGAKLS